MEDRMHFTFKSEHFVGSQLQRENFSSIYVGDDAQWIEVLREFASFLSSVYGYPIDDQIIIKHKEYSDGESKDVETLLRDYW